MTSFTEHFAEDRRLVILRVLAKAPAFTANEYLVQSAIAAYGHAVSRDLVRTDLAWLAEQGLVTVERVHTTHVARMTARGDDVQAGRATVPGVKRPLPGDS